MEAVKVLQKLAISSGFAHKVRAGTVLAHRPALTITRKERAMAAKPIPELTPEVQARFWAKVDRRGPDECWEWRGHRHPRGYGRFFQHQKPMVATRVVLELSGHPRPSESHNALHSCDNPACCNPAHLRWGTQKDNMRDAIERNRIDLAALKEAGRHNSKKDVCAKGHPFVPENTYVTKSGWRACETCRATWRAEYAERKRALAARAHWPKESDDG